MSNKIEGIPEGYELVRIGTPNAGEHYLNCNAAIITAQTGRADRNYVIVRKLLQLEVGKYYKDSTGVVRGPLKLIPTISNGGPLFGLNYTEPHWRIDGTALSVNNLIEEVPAPKPKYRPFNTNEFKQHRDKWFKLKNERVLVKVSYYNDSIVQFSNGTACYLVALHEHATFEDGTPAGVLE